MHPSSRDALFTQLNKVPPPPEVPSIPRVSDQDSSDEEEENWQDASEYLPPGFADEEQVASTLHGPLREDELKELLDQANALKARGNDLFRESNWAKARTTYLEGIHCLPPRPSPRSVKGKGKEPEGTDMDDEEQDEDDSQVATPSLTSDDSPTPIRLLDQQCAVIRSILNANIAACHVKMGDHKSAVESCTESLLDVPTYTKALHRRATSNDALDTWSSLSAAEEDYQTLLDILPPSSPLLPSIRSSLRSVRPRIERAQKTETDEMISKLKGLGDSVLGRFGLSTNNFQFTPNGQGGYSMNFVQ